MAVSAKGAMRNCIICKLEAGDSNWDPGLGYMVKTRVWCGEAGFTYTAGVAHLWCLEKHLGRELGPDDFTDAPLNYLSGHVPEHKLHPLIPYRSANPLSPQSDSGLA